jgi:hypothetical protein
MSSKYSYEAYREFIISIEVFLDIDLDLHADLKNVDTFGYKAYPIIDVSDDNILRDYERYSLISDYFENRDFSDCPYPLDVNEYDIYNSETFY